MSDLDIDIEIVVEDLKNISTLYFLAFIKQETKTDDGAAPVYTCQAVSCWLSSSTVSHNSITFEADILVDSNDSSSSPHEKKLTKTLLIPIEYSIKLQPMPSEYSGGSENGESSSPRSRIPCTVSMGMGNILTKAYARISYELMPKAEPINEITPSFNRGANDWWKTSLFDCYYATLLYPLRTHVDPTSSMDIRDLNVSFSCGRCGGNLTASCDANANSQSLVDAPQDVMVGSGGRLPSGVFDQVSWCVISPRFFYMLCILFTPL